MSAILSLGMGYLIGCISPSAWISKKKNVDLTKEGTKNLGATNTALVLGKAAGIFVMVFDMGKSIFSYKLARYLFPQLAIAGILACIGAIIGHCFPVFMNFQGGKGLAAFGGTVLAYNPLFFLALLIFGLILMIICNYSVVMPMSAAILFPILVYLQSGSAGEALMAGASSLLIIVMHFSNIKKARNHTDIPIRDFIVHKLFRSK